MDKLPNNGDFYESAMHCTLVNILTQSYANALSFDNICVVISALKNKCFGYSPWKLQLSPAVTDRDIKSTLTFTIEDVYRQRKPVTMETYKHHEWFHLAIVNDVNNLRMFVNGVKVSTGEHNFNKTCKEF